MKTLIIHPDDRSTDFLKLVYKDKDYDVINDCFISRKSLINEIKNHDKIIMMGHGTGAGLINPKRGGLLIDDSFADLLRTKDTLSIWCWSDEYFRRNKIPGLHTGVIISEVREQLFLLGDVYLDDEAQLKNMEKFARVVGECIFDTPERVKMYILDHYNDNDEVSKYNRNNIIIL